MRPTVLALFVSLVPLHAKAWQPASEVSPQPAGTLTEGQKRKLHLPYVRALTDCVANAILANPIAVERARQSEWIAAAKLTGPQCDPAAKQMQGIHDQLYGVGTGDVFFRGPYFEDLPRALSVRLQPELNR